MHRVADRNLDRGKLCHAGRVPRPSDLRRTVRGRFLPDHRARGRAADRALSCLRCREGHRTGTRPENREEIRRRHAEDHGGTAGASVGDQGHLSPKGPGNFGADGKPQRSPRCHPISAAVRHFQHDRSTDLPGLRGRTLSGSPRKPVPPRGGYSGNRFCKSR